PAGHGKGCRPDAVESESAGQICRSPPAPDPGTLRLLLPRSFPCSSRPVAPSASPPPSPSAPSSSPRPPPPPCSARVGAPAPRAPPATPPPRRHLPPLPGLTASPPLSGHLLHAASYDS